MKGFFTKPYRLYKDIKIKQIFVIMQQKLMKKLEVLKQYLLKKKRKKDLVSLKSDVIKLDIDEQVNLKQKGFHKI